MSNGTPNNQPNSQPYTNRELIRDVFAGIQSLLLFYVTVISTNNRNNHDRLGQVEQRQEQQEDTASRVKQKLEEKLAQDQKKIEEEVRSQGIQLYSTWRYLEDVSEVSGLAKDVNKAAEAKKLYEEHIKKYNSK